MAEKIKFNDDTELWIARKIERTIRLPDGSLGRTYTIQWTKAEEDVNLGSIVNPNKEIYAFKYKCKDEGISNNLSKLFRGFK